MKRKLALLLAGVMTLAAVPMNIFAAAGGTTGAITSNSVPAAGRTVYYEAGTFDTSYIASSGPVTQNSDIEYYTVGPSIRFEIEDSQSFSITDSLTGTNKWLYSAFKVDLTNANWFLRDHQLQSYDYDLGQYSEAEWNTWVGNFSFGAGSSSTLAPFTVVTGIDVNGAADPAGTYSHRVPFSSEEEMIEYLITEEHRLANTTPAPANQVYVDTPFSWFDSVDRAIRDLGVETLYLAYVLAEASEGGTGTFGTSNPLFNSGLHLPTTTIKSDDDTAFGAIAAFNALTVDEFAKKLSHNMGSGFSSTGWVYDWEVNVPAGDSSGNDGTHSIQRDYIRSNGNTWSDVAAHRIIDNATAGQTSDGVGEWEFQLHGAELRIDTPTRTNRTLTLRRTPASGAFFGNGLPAVNPVGNDGLTQNSGTEAAAKANTGAMPRGTVNETYGIILDEDLYLGFGQYNHNLGDTHQGTVPYLLKINRTGTTSENAEVILLKDALDEREMDRYDLRHGNNGDFISRTGRDIIDISLPIRSKVDSGEVKATVTGTHNNVKIKDYPFILSSAGANKTNTYVMGGAPSGRDEFNITRLVIDEKRPGSLREGIFELIAPTNYVWEFHESATDAGLWLTGRDLRWQTRADGIQGGGANGRESTVEKGRYDTNGGELLETDTAYSTTASRRKGHFANTGTVRGGSDASRNDYYMHFKLNNAGTNVDESTWVVELNAGLIPSADTNGTLTIRGLKLVSRDYNRDTVKSGKLQARIRTQSGSKNTIVTDQTFDIADVADYTLLLSRRTDDIPELVSGRLESVTYRQENTVTANGHNSNWGESDKIEDDYHKAAKVRVAETLPDSWWGSKQTQLVLPEGVKFLKVEFDDVRHISNRDTTLAAKDAYYNSHRRENGFITIDDNTLTLTNLNLVATEKSRFDADIWLNIEVDYEGDIELTLTGYSVKYGPADEQAVVIATAIPPVEIETSVTDVKIGYQYTSVADFDITETRAGNLLRSEVVFVSVTDQIYTDMAIAPGFSAEVSDGDLRISNVRAATSLGASNTVGLRNANAIGAHVRFTIDRPSTDASTISFTNVQVKIDRTVAYSNENLEEERGIDVIAWGPGIAKNFEGIAEVPSGYSGTATLYGTNAYSYDYFATAGIKAKYVNVATNPDQIYSTFTNVVAVTIGSTVVTVNGEEATMPVAPYVSTASNSTMVPVRFVSYALGLDEAAVVWDPAQGTVTVDGGSRVVQFQIGNTNFLVSGVSVPMVSPDGLPVAAEISEERAFIPFRALGDAFGIRVDWDPATSTATYNAPVK